MPEHRNVTKAILQQIGWNEDGEVNFEGPEFEVQFNPETLSLAFSNQVAGGDQAGGSAIQFNSRGTTKLTFDLVFDVTDPKIGERFNKDNQPESRTDVRKVTKLVADFMQTEPKGSGRNQRFVPPGVRMKWGTFRFDGVVDSINEKLDFFSETGVPLRSTLSVSITKQDVDVNFLNPGQDAQGSPLPGTSPTDIAEGDSTMARQVEKDGGSRPWQGDALANGIENPRDIPPGTPLSMGSDKAAAVNDSLTPAAGSRPGGGLGAGGGFGASGGLGVELDAGGGFSIDASSQLALSDGGGIGADLSGALDGSIEAEFGT